MIELPISGDLDINGWELRKALGLPGKGNATLVEWLDSPVVYRADAGFLRAIREASQQVHQPERSFHHYVHMARRNYREFLRGGAVRLKRYLYVLRALLATLWIEQGLGVAPMRFQELVDATVTEARLRGAIEQLLILKRSVPESEHGAPLPTLDAFIESQVTWPVSAAPPERGETDFAVLDRLLMDTVLRMEGLGRAS